MKKLSMIDKGFLLGESREMPMHVGGVSLYTLPDGADEQEFLATLAANVHEAKVLMPPFGDRLKVGPLGLMGTAYWEPDPAFDMDYHVRHSALPKPGRYRELFALVSRLHSSLLERTRPLWEMHIIEGLENRQFAIYSKTHHAAVDGARSIHISRSMLSADPSHINAESPISKTSWDRYKASVKMGHKAHYSDSELRNVADVLKSSFDSSANIFHALKGFTKAWSGQDRQLNFPHLKVPRTSINGNIDSTRRFVAQSWEFARVKKVAEALGGTFNDTVLAMCAGAIRNYLLNYSELPERSLKAMVPVSLREDGDVDAGNAVAAISANLATDIADPSDRFHAIVDSVLAGKDYYRSMSAREIEMVSLLMQAPSMILVPLGLIPRLPPYNLTISNIPGIRQTMYWNGARMDGSYPMSIVAHSMAMNITLVTYDKNVDFGILACRRNVPHVQRMIDYMEDALQELEEVAGFRERPSRKRRSAAAKPKAKITAGTKTKAKAKSKARAKPKATARPKATVKAKAKAKAKTRSKRS